MTRKAFVAELNSFLLGKGFLEETPGKLWIARGKKPGGIQIVVVNGRRQTIQTSGPEIKIQVEVVGEASIDSRPAYQILVRIAQNNIPCYELEEIYYCTKDDLLEATRALSTIIMSI